MNEEKKLLEQLNKLLEEKEKDIVLWEKNLEKTTLEKQLIEDQIRRIKLDFLEAEREKE